MYQHSWGSVEELTDQKEAKKNGCPFGQPFFYLKN